MNDAGHTKGRVLVTGATGFIGRDLVAWLAAEGWQVRAAARDPGAVVGGDGIEAVALGDLGQGVDWRALVEGVTHVVHLAGIAHATTRIPDATYHAVNAEAVRTLAVAARAAGVARVVMMSSVRAQCGPAVRGTLTEERAPAPVDAYGRSKLEGERLLATELGECATDWCVLRPVVVYGPGVKANFLALMKAISRGWPLPLASVRNARSLVYVGNLVDAILGCLGRDATFLVSDGAPVSTPGLCGEIGRALGRPARLFPFPTAWLPAKVAASLELDDSAIRRAHGWHPPFTLEQGLGETARWYRGR